MDRAPGLVAYLKIGGGRLRAVLTVVRIEGYWPPDPIWVVVSRRSIARIPFFIIYRHHPNIHHRLWQAFQVLPEADTRCTAKGV